MQETSYPKRLITGAKFSERQYKAQIQRMKLEQNVKSEEQRVIVRHIQHRSKNLGKGSHVRVRGHEIREDKLLRWLRDAPEDPLWVTMNCPPSRKSIAQPFCYSN